jgi:hypothetical protein
VLETGERGGEGLLDGLGRTVELRPAVAVPDELYPDERVAPHRFAQSA